MISVGVLLCGYAEQLTPRLRSASDKNPNDLYYGLVALPGLERREYAYVKLFPPNLRGQLVYNEVVAYYLALQCELPVPFTFPCACRKSLLRRFARDDMTVPGSDFVLGVASVDACSKPVRQQLLASEAQIVDVLNWPYVARAAVFDELMGNDDRHLANLIRRGPHDYVLIDNERILFAEQWFGSDLKSFELRQCDSNILADTIAETTDEVMRHRMMAVAQHLTIATILSAPEVCVGIEQLCGAPEGTTYRLIEMLNARRTRLRGLMQWHLQKGDLFQARTNR